MAAALPDEFQPSALVERIILGAIQADQVRLHGAIVAALELHGAAANGQRVRWCSGDALPCVFVAMSEDVYQPGRELAGVDVVSP